MKAQTNCRRALSMFLTLTLMLTLVTGFAPAAGADTEGDGEGSAIAQMDYTISGSTYTRGSNTPLILTIDKDFALFSDVKLGDTTLVRDTDYTAESASTKITLLPTYLDTLLAGRHTVVVGFTDNRPVNISFTVDAPLQPIEPMLPTNPYVDVRSTDWFIDAVIYANDRGLMSGTSANPMTFSPEMAVTRGMVVTVLYRHHGVVPSIAYGNPLSDVAAGMFYHDAVLWAYHNGIVSGYGDGHFGPNDLIMRQDLAVILKNYMDFLGVNLAVTADWRIFADQADIANYAMDAIQTFNKLGIINGMGTNATGQTIINPRGQATRAQFATMLMNFLNKVE